jgi:hypothetical protein
MGVRESAGRVMGGVEAAGRVWGWVGNSSGWCQPPSANIIPAHSAFNSSTRLNPIPTFSQAEWYLAVIPCHLS